MKKSLTLNLRTKPSVCTVCGSIKTTELYPSEVTPGKISFNYKFSPLSNKTFRVVRCVACSHVFCSPIPKDIYKNYQDVIDDEYLEHSLTRRLSAKEVLKKVKKYKSSGKLLDVGCATGDFLLEVKNFNYEIEGLELSKWSTKIAQSHGLKIHRQTLKSLASKYPKKYDVISLWGVIEHFESPKDEMIFLNKLLKPGGLLVLWTGDVDGFMSRILRRKWWYWQGQHIQYFTSSSLDRLGEAHGFKHLNTSIYPLAVTWDQISNSLNRYKLKNIISIFIRPLFILKPIWYLRIPGEMFWIAKKREEIK